jgi:hypothetical protein
VCAQWARRSVRKDNQEVGSEAATLERVRNSSLVEWTGAANSPGLKHTTEAADLLPRKGEQVVGERPALQRRHTGRSAGARGSANAGMSSDKHGENPCHRKPQGS